MPWWISLINILRLRDVDARILPPPRKSFRHVSYHPSPLLKARIVSRFLVSSPTPKFVKSSLDRDSRPSLQFVARKFVKVEPACASRRREIFSGSIDRPRGLPRVTHRRDSIAEEIPDARPNDKTAHQSR